MSMGEDDKSAFDALISASCGEDEVGHGDHWRVFVEDLDELIEILPRVAQLAQPLKTCADDPDSAPLALPVTEPVGELVAWPNADRGMILVQTADAVSGEAVILSAYPATTSGVAHMAKIESIRLWPGRLEAQIDAKVGTGMTVTFFDLHFAKNRVFYRKGGFYPIVLSAVAYETRIYEGDVTAALPCKLTQDGQSPDDYAFIGRVTASRTIRFFESPVLLLRVVVGQVVLPFDEPVEIDLIVTDASLNFSRAPDVNDSIYGKLWLTGYLKKPASINH